MEHSCLRNKKGKTIQDRIEEDIEYAKNIKDEKSRKLLATKALGALDFAVEFGLIAYNVWEKYIEQIFKLI